VSVGQRAIFAKAEEIKEVIGVNSDTLPLTTTAYYLHSLSYCYQSLQKKIF